MAKNKYWEINMMQPNFNKWFDVNQYERVSYVVRRDGNLLHDLAYLNSYINDAECYINEIKLKNNILTIPINRICWETFIAFKKLVDVRSEIIFKNVADYYFYLPKDFFSITEYEIKNVYYSVDENIVVVANSFTFFKICILPENDKDIIIKLEDNVQK